MMTIEASNVIKMRLQIISNGDAAGWRESELMISEKLEAFTQAGLDMAAGTPNSVIQSNIRTLVRANEARLTALIERAG